MPPPPDTQGPAVTESTSTTTTTTETPLDPAQPPLEVPPPTVVDGDIETTLTLEETAPVPADDLLGAGAVPSS